MTDNEIIKAAEECDSCIVFSIVDWDKKEHTDITLADLVGVMKRQQAEIDKLNTNIETLESVIKRSFFNKAGFDIDPFAEIKAEAIKKFAERLCEDRISNDPVVIAVKVELKEMVGED